MYWKYNKATLQSARAKWFVHCYCELLSQL